MKTKKIIAIILAIILTIGMLATLVACNTADTTKRAIIYVTALFSGGLYYPTTDEITGETYNQAIWEPFPEFGFDIADLMSGDVDLSSLGIDLEDTDNLLNNVLELLGFSSITDLLDAATTIISDLSLDQDGNSNNPAVIPANNKPKDRDGKVMDISYGVFGVYKPFVDNLKAKYGDKYEVSVFNYDWRYSPADAGAKLEKYINDNGYDEVILMSHSMGGPTVNQYLVKNKANRDKVKLYMGFAPATMGSFDALAALTCPMDYLKYMAGDLLNDIPSYVLTAVESVLKQFGDFLFNNIGLMTLIPSYQYLASGQYGDDEAGIYVMKKGETEYKALTKKDEIYNFYMTRDWAYYLDENGKKIKDAASPVGYKLKKPVKNLANYYDSFYLDGKFAADTINSYYFVGTGIGTTITGLKYDENTNKYTLLTNTGSEKLGDGTVPYYSSIGGQNPSKIKEGRLIEYAGHNHLEVGADFELLKDDIYRLIDSVI